jgi:hypothetical protein
MNLQKIVLFPMLAIGLVAGGCSIAAEGSDEFGPPPVAGPEPAGEVRDESGLAWLGPTWTESTLPARGGSGGGYIGHVTPAAVIFGIQVRSGAEIDAISFGYYQPVWSDNVWRTGDPYAWTPLYGGGGGTLRTAFTCPPTKGVIGLRGNASSRVDRIGVICGDVNNPDPTNPDNDQSPLWGTPSGGAWFEDKCTLGRLIDSFNLREGARLDRIQGICIDAH